MRINKSARAYISEHKFSVGDRYLVPDLSDIPAAAEQAMRRLFGRPRTIDRGEVAYWEVPSTVIDACDA